ncbi:hypothetical protein [Rhodoferax sp. WC2427]|uniref:hypothetical protein n=1 Tax=Rhodoferax sp. WC2427 TaxID=3234144 RepID=UPI0034667D13
MQKIFTNDTNSPMYVRGQMIPPGEQVMLEVPDEAAPLAAAPLPTLAELVALELKKPVPELVAGFAATGDDALDMMAALEGQADKPRTTLLTALADERIRRADAKLTSDPL